MKAGWRKVEIGSHSPKFFLTFQTHFKHLNFQSFMEQNEACLPCTIVHLVFFANVCFYSKLKDKINSITLADKDQIQGLLAINKSPLRFLEEVAGTSWRIAPTLGPVFEIDCNLTKSLRAPRLSTRQGDRHQTGARPRWSLADAGGKSFRNLKCPLLFAILGRTLQLLGVL